MRITSSDSHASGIGSANDTTRVIYDQVVAIGAYQNMISYIDGKIAAVHQARARAYKEFDDKVASLEIERAALSVSIKTAATKIALSLPGQRKQ